MRIAMIGTGYVGLVSGACFSDFGHEVICVDKDADKIASLQAGEIPIYEPGLDVLVNGNMRVGRLTFSTDLAAAVPDADAVFIAVGTPSRRGDGHADLRYVYAAASEIAPLLAGYTVVITKSTVPVGTGDEVEKRIRTAAPDADVDVASNPEFLREGSAIEDFKRPDRIVVGTTQTRAQEVMRELYRPLFLRETPMVFTNRQTSELIKYAGNAFLATKITFINEMADICEKVGANVLDVAKGIGLDNRIGKLFLHAGPGYGGSCFPKDTLALVKTAEDVGAPTSIVSAVVAANATRKTQMADKLIAAAGGTVSGKKIAVLGVTFKPNTDDMRDAPSLDIIPLLQRAGATIAAFDPAGMDQAAQLLPGVAWAASAQAAMQDADILLILTEWNEFRALQWPQVADAMAGRLIVDLRNIYEPSDVAQHGFSYYSIGRPVAMREGDGV